MHTRASASIVSAGIYAGVAALAALALVLAVSAHAAPEVSIDEHIGPPDAPESVRIFRDRWGVPHIYAQREEDGYFGLGYAQGEDILTPLMQIVLVMLGQGAAVFGAEFVEADLRSLQWQHVAAGRAGFQRLSPQLQRNYASYTAGMRHYMATHPDKTPPWVPELEPWMWVTFTRGLAWEYMIQDGLRDCRAGGVELASLDAEFLRRGDAGLLASNQWFLAPWRTADGATMLLSDPHGEIDGWLFHEFRMRAGALDVHGFGFGPMMLLTHNRDVAWGMTTGAPDVSDCYAIELDPTDPRAFHYDGRPQSMTVESVQVEVKGGPAVAREFEYTRHNGALAPVVARRGATAYVVSTSYMDAAGLWDEEMYRMNLARNVADVRKAHELMGMFPQNVISVDRFGRSHYLRAGRAPRRPPGVDWTRPVPGNSAATAWQGLHESRDLVSLEDPPAGYMQINNTPPWMMIGSDRGPSPEDYLDYLYYDTPVLRYTMRGRRTIEVLSNAYAFTVDDALALAVDDTWYGTERWQAALGRALDHVPDTVRGWPLAARTVAQRLLTFDRRGRADSTAALAYFHWRTILAERLDPAAQATLDAALNSGAPLPLDIVQVLVAAVPDTAAAMTTAYGTIDRPYGDVFRIGRTPERSWPVSGSAPLDVRRHGECRATDQITLPCPLTQRAFIAGGPDAQGQRLITAGSRAMRVVVFTEPLQSYSLHNFGQSSDTDSEHYEDQARELVSQGRLKPTYFEPESLRGQVKSVVTLRATPR